jgi:anti-repressor protein
MSDLVRINSNQVATQIFNNPEFGELRTIEEGDKIYFVATDAARMLGYAKPSNAVSAHCKGALKRGIPTSGGVQQMNVIPEGDLYRLIVNSELPSAEKFESWVFDEVLPAIRKTGGYHVPQSPEEQMAQGLLAAQKLLAEKDKRIEEMRPKEIFADAVSVSKTDILIGDLAKLIKQNGHDIGQKRLFAWLREKGYLIKRKGLDWNMPTQRAMEMKLFRVKETVVTHADGHTTVNKTPKVTGKGQIYFVNKFLRDKAATVV